MLSPSFVRTSKIPPLAAFTFFWWYTARYPDTLFERHSVSPSAAAAARASSAPIVPLISSVTRWPRVFWWR